MLYIIILIYILSLVVIYDINNNKNGKNFNFLFLLIIFICTAGFSYRLGIDSIVYESFYLSYPSLNDINWDLIRLFNENQGEPLWLIINSLIKNFTNDFCYLKIFIAIFVNCSIFWFVKKHSGTPFMVILFYYLFQFWNFNYEILRESLTLSLFLLALHQILDGKNNITLYYLIIIPAIFIQYFSIFALFFPLLKRFYAYNLKTLILFSFIAIPFIMSVSGFIVNLGVFNETITDKMNNKYLLGNNIYGDGVFNLFGVIQRLGIIALSFNMLVSIKNKIDKNIYSYAIIYSLVLILTMGFAVLYRVNNYFSILFYICIASYVKELFSIYKNDLFRYSVIVLFIILMIQPKFDVNYYRKYTPYSSIFNPVYNYEREIIYIK